MRRLIRDNALSLVMFGLFALFLLGQGVTGFQVLDEERTSHGQPPIGPLDYLTSGHFVEATFENWESEFLQMGALVLLTVALHQRGSKESKDPDAEEEVDREPDPTRPGAPGPMRVGGLVREVYEHSLTLALFGLFFASFALHALGGLGEHDRELAAHGEPPVGLVEFVESPDFWFQSFQNWQSEFLSVGVLVVLTIFLRQRGSPESKPVDEPHTTTGGG
ncbi:MAG: DUF6766 family protein [Chloroflexota bacterium]